MTIRQAHRWISLVVALIWLIQAITGTLSVFRWEIDEATVAGARVPVSFAAVGNRVDALDRMPDLDVSSVWTSGTSAGRFDVHYSRAETSRVMRIDGQGGVLRDRSYQSVAAQGAIWDTITAVHTSLLADDAGAWLIGISGILLLTNLLLGLKLAWPKRNGWRKVLFGRPAGGAPARLYAWHRKVGLWLALPTLITVTAGTMLVFSGGIEHALGAEVDDPVVAQPGGADRRIGLNAAIRAAQQTFPQASFAGASLPREDAPWYRIRLRNPGELPRKWGTTIVFVAAGDGRVLQSYDAASPRPERAIVDSLYALHTGQAGGLAGRLVALLVGAAMLAMIGLGLALWWTRRTVRKV